MKASIAIALFLEALFVSQSESVVVGAFVMPHGKFDVFLLIAWRCQQ